MTLPCKPHPFGNTYHLIADSDGGKPIMWRIKIVEGKDCPKKAGGTWAFPSKYEPKGYSKTVNLLLDMTDPIHCRAGKVVTGDSGFCVAMGVMALQTFGVHSQLFLIKGGSIGRSTFPATTSTATWRRSHWATRRRLFK